MGGVLRFGRPALVGVAMGGKFQKKSNSTPTLTHNFARILVGMTDSTHNKTPKAGRLTLLGTAFERVLSILCRLLGLEGLCAYVEYARLSDLSAAGSTRLGMPAGSWMQIARSYSTTVALGCWDELKWLISDRGGRAPNLAV